MTKPYTCHLCASFASYSLSCCSTVFSLALATPRSWRTFGGRPRAKVRARIIWQKHAETRHRVQGSMIKGEKKWLGRLYWTVVPSCDEKEECTWDCVFCPFCWWIPALDQSVGFNQEALCCFSTLVSVATWAGFLPTSFNGILARQSQREGSVPLDPYKRTKTMTVAMGFLKSTVPPI